MELPLKSATKSKTVRPLLPIDANDIAFHRIAYEKSKLFFPITRKKLLSIYAKNGRGAIRPNGRSPSIPRPFFGGMQETTDN